MSITQLLCRFSLVYFLGLIGITVLLSVLGTKLSSSNLVALLAATVYVCHRFCELNERRMTATESRRAWLGMWSIDTVLQLAVLLLLKQTHQAPAIGDYQGMFFALAFVVLLHGAVLWAMVKHSGRLFDKQQAAKRKSA